MSFHGQLHSRLLAVCPGVELRVTGYSLVWPSFSPTVPIPPAIGQSSSLPTSGGDISVHVHKAFFSLGLAPFCLTWIFPTASSLLPSLHFPPSSPRDFLFYFYLLIVGLLACEILVSQPGIELGSLAVKAASPKLPEEVPWGNFKTLTIFTEEPFIVLTTLPWLGPFQATEHFKLLLRRVWGLGKGRSGWVTFSVLF